VVQQRLASDYTMLAAGDERGMTDQHKAFKLSIGYQKGARGKKLVQVTDPVNFPICGDAGISEDLSSPGVLAYPEICCAECAGVAPFDWGWGGVAAGISPCPTGEGCPECAEMHAINSWWTADGYDITAKKASTRHLGGVNLGWLDGHASWINSERLIARFAEGEIEGVEMWYPEGSREYYIANVGDPGEREFLF
jgi:prepilin-type processing-associated H-X9-DG protein